MTLIALAFYLFVSVRVPAFKTNGLLGKKVGRLILPAAALMALAFILYNFFPFIAQAVKGCFLSLPVLLAGGWLFFFGVNVVSLGGGGKEIAFFFFFFLGLARGGLDVRYNFTVV